MLGYPNKTEVKWNPPSRWFKVHLFSAAPVIYDGARELSALGVLHPPPSPTVLHRLMVISQAEQGTEIMSGNGRQVSKDPLLSHTDRPRGPQQIWQMFMCFKWVFLCCLMSLTGLSYTRLQMFQSTPCAMSIELKKKKKLHIKLWHQLSCLGGVVYTTGEIICKAFSIKKSCLCLRKSAAGQRRPHMPNDERRYITL